MTTKDPLETSQWHLNATGIDRLGGQYKGAGISVGVFDDGLDKAHKDLAANYDSSKEYVYGGIAQSPSVGAFVHGTAVAGLIAADDNGIGGVGIAPDAGITGYDLFGNAGGSRMLDAMNWLTKVDVANHSWGWTDPYGDALSGSFGAQFAAKLEAASLSGRGGLGTVIVQSAGNEWDDDLRSANTSEFGASRYTVTVSAVGQNGDVSYYANRGANVLVAGPSNGGGAGLVTTDTTGTGGYSPGDWTTTFGGTSGAAPVVSGIVALMLEASGERLGWRDVQDILAITADHTTPTTLSGTATGQMAYGWQINGADNVNGGGAHVSNDIGFGRVDGYEAVRLAEVWHKFGPAHTSANEVKTSVSGNASLSVPDTGSTSFVIQVARQMLVEHVDLTLTIDHPNVKQLQIELVSPDGTKSIMLSPMSGAAKAASAMTWTYGSELSRGEMAEGAWTVVMRDTVTGSVGKVGAYRLDVYGSEPTADDVHHFTGEFAKMASLDASRTELVDADGGVDWIDAAAIASGVAVDLSTTAGFIKIKGAPQVTIQGNIENVVGGDGADVLTGNEGSNELAGMRGDDLLQGMGAADTIDGGEGVDTASYAASDAAVKVDLTWNTMVGGHAQGDKLIGIENIAGSDFGDTLGGNAGANVFTGGKGDDVIDGRLGDDTAVFSGNRADYAFVKGTDAKGAFLQVVDAVSGRDGADKLYSIQFLKFADGTISSNDVRVSILGTSGADTLTGDAQANRIEGLAGDDTLIGGGGADTLDGGAGNDVVSYAANAVGVKADLTWATMVGGDAQGDVLIGIEGIVGSNFADQLGGDAGANYFFGGKGDDTIDGRLGDDTVGFTGKRTEYAFTKGTDAKGAFVQVTDTVAGRDGVDKLYSIQFLKFADGIVPTDNVFPVAASAGNDLLKATALADTFDGQAGIDTVDYSGSNAAVKVDFTWGTMVGGHAQGDTIKNVENVIGSAFDDQLGGDGGANVFTGGKGNDTIDGKLGDDTAVFSGNRADYTFAKGTDSKGAYVMVTDGTAGRDGIDKLYSIQFLKFADGTTPTETAFQVATVGTAEADLLTGDAQGNTIRGMEGDDTIVGGGGADTIDGGQGSDTASYAGSSAGVKADLTWTTMVGGDAQGDLYTSIENLIGSDFADQLGGDGGANVFTGGKGNDVIEGRLGDDTAVFSGARSDYTFTKGSDGKGAYVIVTDGTAGRDGVDKLYSVQFLKFADGTIPADDAFRAPGTGTGGADFLEGTDQADQLRGLAGDDVLLGRGGADTLDGGAGSDTAAYGSSIEGVSVDLGKGIATGGDAQGDKLISIENVEGSLHDDVLRGDDGSNVLTGLVGDDLLDGGEGIDTVIYHGRRSDYSVIERVDEKGVTYVEVAQTAQGSVSDGVDRLYSIERVVFADQTFATKDLLASDTPHDAFLIATGASETHAGTKGGVDTVSFIDSTSSVRIDLATGTATGGFAQGDKLVSIENVVGTRFADELRGDGADNLFRGAAGNDTIHGGAGDDTVGYAYDKSEYVLVKGVDDNGAYVEVAHTKGIDGIDRVYSTETFEFSGGAIRLEDIADYKPTPTPPPAPSGLIGTTGDDAIVGTSGNDVFRFGQVQGGDDTLDGKDGYDGIDLSAISASTGTVVSLDKGTMQIGQAIWKIGSIEDVVGSDGKDVIRGNAMDNIIEGGKGDDILWGGANVDTFVFGANSGTDRIEDFVVGEDLLTFGVGMSVDKLNLEVVGADLYVSDSDSTVILVGGANFHLTNDDLMF